MPTNLEYKAKIDSSRKYSTILKKIARFCGIMHQTDTYFNIPKGRLKLREFSRDPGELIYYVRNEERGKRWSKYRIVRVSDTSNLLNLLAEMLKIRVVVKKERRVFNYKNSARIHLDVVRGLGEYIEIESIARHGRREAALVYLDLIRILHLSEVDAIKGSYADLLVAKLKEKTRRRGGT